MKNSKKEKGSILLIFLMTLPFLILIALNYTQLSLTSFQVANLDYLRTEAQLAADAGADYAISQINQDNAWAGTTSDIQLRNDPKMRSTFSASVTGDENAKTVAITGKTYFPANSSTPERTVRINLDLRPVTSGNYSLVSGEGGLIMMNSSKIVGGDVYVNGTVNISNTAQIGLSTKPINLSVANQACPTPPDATYPRVCASGEGPQPIIIQNQARIYGTVKATGQTNTSGMSDPGLVAGSPAPLALPTHDRVAQKTAATNNMTGTAASCSGNGSVIWPANTKISGNVTTSQSCTVTIKGNVWITGNFDMENSSRIVVDNGVGTTRPVIMVDGSTGANFKNTSQIIQNTSGTGIEVITFHSAASCSPDCPSVTGTDLYNSRFITTLTLNNSSAGASSIFYAYWTQIEVGNSGQIGAVLGQTVKLTNTGTITFGASSGTETTTWVVQGYRRR